MRPTRSTGAETLEEPSLRRELAEAKGEAALAGGWSGLKSGSWFYDFARRSFRNYYERATPEYFQAKYPGQDSAFIADKLLSVAAKNSLVLGSLTGAAISADELVGLATGGEGGLGIPANVLIAVTAAGAELFLLLRLQLHMIAGLARLYGVPLDPDDPEDILTIFSFALGGSVAEEAGRLGMKVGARVTRDLVERYAGPRSLLPWKKLGKRVGARMFRKTVAKYAVPLVSVGIGAGWNYLSTKAVGKLALRHFRARAKALEAGEVFEHA